MENTSRKLKTFSTVRSGRSWREAIKSVMPKVGQSACGRGGRGRGRRRRGEKSSVYSTEGRPRPVGGPGAARSAEHGCGARRAHHREPVGAVDHLERELRAVPNGVEPANLVPQLAQRLVVRVLGAAARARAHGRPAEAAGAHWGHGCAVGRAPGGRRAQRAARPPALERGGVGAAGDKPAGRLLAEGREARALRLGVRVVFVRQGALLVHAVGIHDERLGRRGGVFERPVHGAHGAEEAAPRRDEAADCAVGVGGGGGEAVMRMRRRRRRGGGGRRRGRWGGPGRTRDGLLLDDVPEEARDEHPPVAGVDEPLLRGRGRRRAGEPGARRSIIFRTECVATLSAVAWRTSIGRASASMTIWWSIAAGGRERGGGALTRGCRRRAALDETTTKD